MSAVLLPLYLIAAALLVRSSVGKLAQPGPAAAALTELGLRGTGLVVRTGALVELAAAAAMVLRPGVGAPAGAALYLGFSALVAAQLRRGSTRSCGCLGGTEVPPTRAHVALNLALAGVCAVARPDPLGVLVHHPAVGSVVWLAAVAAAWGVAAALELVPPALAAYRRPTS